MTLTSNNQHEILITISDASLETTDEETLTYFRIKQEFQKGYVGYKLRCPLFLPIFAHLVKYEIPFVKKFITCFVLLP